MATTADVDLDAVDSENVSEITNLTKLLKKGKGKRSLPSSNTEPLTKKSRISLPLNSIPYGKTPLMILSELFDISKDFTFIERPAVGPPHAPEFSITVSLKHSNVLRPGTSEAFDGRIEVEGVGSNKKNAKHLAAANLLVVLGCLKTADGWDSPSKPPAPVSNTPSAPESANGSLKRSSSKASLNNSAVEKTPVQVLNELQPGLEYTYQSVPGPRACQNLFHCFVVYKDQKFQGESKNKKIAKQNAAASVLIKEFGIQMDSESAKSVPTTPSAPNQDVAILEGEPGKRNVVFGDLVQTLIKDKFRELGHNLTSQYSARKVLAGVVLTRPGKNGGPEETRVICVTTGTKVLSGDCLSSAGTAMNDCHAEILARRCVQEHLYSQIAALQNRAPLPEGEWTILEIKDGSYSLKDGVEFHMYVSSAPCGDSRIFIAQVGSAVNLELDEHPDRRSRGVLRTKIESGEGTIPIQTNGLQTWDAILASERLLTMSCSDKVCLWNCMGLQGALLSSLIPRPIYLSSMVVAYLNKHVHLHRALYSRARGVAFPPAARAVGYKPTCPDLLGVISQEERNTAKSPNFGINWLSSDPATIEVLHCNKGVTVNNDAPSRLCKHSFLTRFASLAPNEYLASTLPCPSPCGDTFSTPHNPSYAEVKCGAGKVYMEAKVALFRHFKATGMGSWCSKPMEQDRFQLSD